MKEFDFFILKLRFRAHLCKLRQELVTITTTPNRLNHGRIRSLIQRLNSIYRIIYSSQCGVVFCKYVLLNQTERRKDSMLS